MKRMGGKTFPKYDLAEIVQHADKLVGKAAHSKLNADAVAAALGMARVSSQAQIKIAAAKQYGLIEGTYEKFDVTDLCQRLAEATSDDEKRPCLQECFLKVPTFREVWDAYCGTTKSRDAISSMAVSKGVADGHRQKFMEMFVAGVTTAGLAEDDNGSVSFIMSSAVTPQPGGPGEEADQDEDEDVDVDVDVDVERGSALVDSTKATAHPEAQGSAVSIAIDSSLDPEKLERHLAALRKYGLI
jgi:hypothetical protein